MSEKISIESIIANLERFIEESRPISPSVWLESAMRLNALLGKFDEELIKSEVAYRGVVVNHIAEGDTNAMAEAKAKITEEYIKYRVMDLRKKQICEFILLAKKRSTIQDV
jgi:hypothetical protein